MKIIGNYKHTAFIFLLYKSTQGMDDTSSPGFYPGVTVRKTPTSKHEVKPLVFMGVNGR